MPTKAANLHEDFRKFIKISRWIFLRMRNVLHKSCRENQNTFYVNFSPEIVLRVNVEKYRTAGKVTDDRQYGAYALYTWCLMLQRHCFM